LALVQAWETPERVIEIFAKSKRISEALAEGKFKEDWQDFLAEAVGLQEANQVEKQA